MSEWAVRERHETCLGRRISRRNCRSRQGLLLQPSITMVPASTWPIPGHPALRQPSSNCSRIQKPPPDRSGGAFFCVAAGRLFGVVGGFGVEVIARIGVGAVGFTLDRRQRIVADRSFGALRQVGGMLFGG